MKKPLDPKAQALKLLSRREHSAREISDEDAAAAVDHAGSEGWQSDARYAEMLVRTRAANGYGPVRIQADLGVAGVPSDEIRAALDAAGVDWRELAAQVHAKKFG